VTLTQAAREGGFFCASVTDSFDDVAGGAGVAALVAALRRVVAEPAGCLGWLDGLRRDDAAVAAIATRSYWHPNGFAKLILHAGAGAGAGAGVRIRLHVWPAAGAPRLGESNPHSHRWEFASTVLAGGGLDMVEYVETGTGGDAYVRHRYGADPTDRAALLRDGPVRLRPVRTPRVRLGGVYSCTTDVVHTVAPVGTGLTATLVFQGPQRTPSTVVYREPGLGDDQPNSPLTQREVRGLVGAVLDARNGTPDGDR
jgi:hypothetical protein